MAKLKEIGYIAIAAAAAYLLFSDSVGGGGGVDSGAQKKASVYLGPTSDGVPYVAPPSTPSSSNSSTTDTWEYPQEPADPYVPNDYDQSTYPYTPIDYTKKEAATIEPSIFGELAKTAPLYVGVAGAGIAGHSLIEKSAAWSGLKGVQRGTASTHYVYDMQKGIYKIIAKQPRGLEFLAKNPIVPKTINYIFDVLPRTAIGVTKPVGYVLKSGVPLVNVAIVSDFLTMRTSESYRQDPTGTDSSSFTAKELEEFARTGTISGLTASGATSARYGTTNFDLKYIGVGVDPNVGMFDPLTNTEVFGPPSPTKKIKLASFGGRTTFITPGGTYFDAPTSQWESLFAGGAIAAPYTPSKDRPDVQFYDVPAQVASTKKEAAVAPVSSSSSSEYSTVSSGVTRVYDTSTKKEIASSTASASTYSGMTTQVFTSKGWVSTLK